MSVENQVIEFSHADLKGKLIRVIIDSSVNELDLNEIKTIVKKSVDSAVVGGGGAILPAGIHIEVIHLY